MQGMDGSGLPDGDELMGAGRQGQNEGGGERLDGLPELLTANEVAGWLRCHPATVVKMARRGDLPCITCGNLIRFVKRDIERLLPKDLV